MISEVLGPGGGVGGEGTVRQGMTAVSSLVPAATPDLSTTESYVLSNGACGRGEVLIGASIEKPVTVADSMCRREALSKTHSDKQGVHRESTAGAGGLECGCTRIHIS